MSTTRMFSGMNEDAKPSSRVLRPPGGGSSQIFGGASDEPSPKASKPYQKTSLFGSEAAQEAPATGKRAGGPTGAAASPFATDVQTPPAPAAAPAQTKAAPASSILAPSPPEPVKQSPAKVASGNPLTGDGPAQAPAPAGAPIHTSTKVRQPPGGASSGPLW